MTEVAEKVVQEVDLKTQVEELAKKIDSFSKKIDSFSDDHEFFRKVHVSRRGESGGRGEIGPVGPQGPPADHTQVAEIAANLVQKALRYETQVSKFENLIKEFESEIVALRGALRFAIIEELQLSGFVDAEGRAVPGPTGATGASVVGPKGDDGLTVVGPRGRDAKIEIGSVTVGSEASVSLREHEGVHVLDLVLPRAERGEQGLPGRDGVSDVPGERGERGEQGPEGLRGYTGIDGFSREQVIALIGDLKARGYFRQ